MRSIQAHLTSWLSVVVLVTLLGTGAAVDSIATVRLTGGFDNELLEDAGAIGALLKVRGGQLEFDAADAIEMTELEQSTEPIYFEVWDSRGAVIERSVALKGDDLPFRFGSLEEPSVFDLPLPDGRHGRAAGIEVPVDAEAGGDGATGARAVVVVAQGREELDQTLRILDRTVLVPGLFATLIAVALTWVACRRSLAPLARIAAKVAAIDASRLNARISEPGLPRELAPIAGRVDDLLERLESSFERERRMNSSLAHELRTPIAELRAAAEIAKRWPDDPGLARAAVEVSAEVSLRMGTFVSALLKLARVEDGHAELDPQTVPLRLTIDAIWRASAADAAPREIGFSNEVAADVSVVCDRELLGIVLGNLLSNAARHADRATTVACRAERSDGSVHCAIENAASGLDQRDLVPTTTQDVARRAGIGLSLARRAALLLSAPLELSIDGGSLLARLELPDPALPGPLP